MAFVLFFKKKTVKQVKRIHIPLTSFPSISNMGPPDKNTWTLPFQPAPCARQNSKNDPADLPPRAAPSSGECGWTLSTWGDTALVTTSRSMAKERFIITRALSKQSFLQLAAEGVVREIQSTRRIQWAAAGLKEEGTQWGGMQGSLEAEHAPRLTASSRGVPSPTTKTNCILPTSCKFEKGSCPGPLEESHLADTLRSALSTEHRKAWTDFTYRAMS